MLIHAGADVNATDVRGFTPLHIVARSGNEEAMIILLDSGALTDITSEAKFLRKTALHRARTGRMVQILLEYYADPYSR